MGRLFGPLCLGEFTPPVLSALSQTQTPHSGRVMQNCVARPVGVQRIVAYISGVHAGRAGHNRAMKYVCDAPGRKTWFRIETEHEAEAEAQLLRHAVDKYFKRELERAKESWRAPAGAAVSWP